jgi:Tfp pilus assembly protein PilF
MSVAALWNLPAEVPTHATGEWDPRTCVPDPRGVAAVRLLQRNSGVQDQGALQALSAINYPQAAGTLPGESVPGPSAQRYFDALRKARQAAANPPQRTAVRNADAHLNYGRDLLGRGAINSAYDEYMAALWSVAYTHDAQTAVPQHVNQLAAALEALDEAEQFAHLPRTSDSHIAVSRLASRHRCSAARRVVRHKLDAVTAMQTYCDVARAELVQAVDGDAAGAAALYGLARTTEQRASRGIDVASFAAPRCMALLLAAHEVAPDNHRVSNELGVMYARFGELAKAEKLLKRSLLVQEHAESWHNLSGVWQLAGKNELATYAQKRAEQLRSSQGHPRTPHVRLVAAAELPAAAAPAETPSEPPPETQTAAPPTAEPSGYVEKTSWLMRMFSKRPKSVARQTTERLAETGRPGTG